MDRKTSIKVLENNLNKAFSQVKEDVNQLKKSKKHLQKEVQDLSIQQLALSKEKAQETDLTTLKRAVDDLKDNKKQLSYLDLEVSTLKKEVVPKKDFIKEQKSNEKEFKKIHNEVRLIKKIKDAITESRLKDIEKNFVQLSDLKEVVLEDISRKYYTAEEVSVEIGNVKKEFLELKTKVLRMRKDLLDFPRTRLLANLLLILSVISFAGAGIAVWLEYTQAANFLAVEAIVLLIIGVFMRLIVAIMK